MKKELLNRLLPATLLLPVIYIGINYGTYWPFGLNGKHFLMFYAMLCSIGVLVILSQQQREYQVLEISVLMLVMIVGCLRIVQGLFNHKPIGYLALIMLVFFSFGSGAVKARLKEKQ